MISSALNKNKTLIDYSLGPGNYALGRALTSPAHSSGEAEGLEAQQVLDLTGTDTAQSVAGATTALLQAVANKVNSIGGTPSGGGPGLAAPPALARSSLFATTQVINPPAAAPKQAPAATPSPPSTAYGLSTPTTLASTMNAMADPGQISSALKLKI